MFYFSIDNKEEMFIRSASVQAAHNSLLNIQYIFYTHTIQLRHPAKSVCLTTPPYKKRKSPLFRKFSVFYQHKCLFRYYFAYIIEHEYPYMFEDGKCVFSTLRSTSHSSHISTHITQISLSLLHSLYTFASCFFLWNKKNEYFCFAG